MRRPGLQNTVHPHSVCVSWNCGSCDGDIAISHVVWYADFCVVRILGERNCLAFIGLLVLWYAIHLIFVQFLCMIPVSDCLSVCPSIHVPVAGTSCALDICR